MTIITPIILAFVLIVTAIVFAGVLLARQRARSHELREYEKATSSMIEEEMPR